ncbi:PQ loop repeat-containing protein 2 [Dinochytrium kinnereticum]|nr:PQ loop repeat-containing protein 2 [Dinochytrium kinnereticum]
MSAEHYVHRCCIDEFDDPIQVSPVGLGNAMQVVTCAGEENQMRPFTINSMCSIGTWFGDCVRTPAEIASFSSGIASLLCYIVALFPQMWMNYKRKSVEGLSAGLVVIWAFGDICNLTGAILTNQLRTQVFVATYFVLVDIVIVLQFLWYTKLRVLIFHLQPREGTEREPLLPPHSGGENVDFGRSHYATDGKKVVGVGASTSSLDSNEGTLVSGSASSVDVSNESARTVSSLPSSGAVMAGAVAIAIAGLAEGASAIPVSLFGLHDHHGSSLLLSLAGSATQRFCDQRLPMSEFAIVLGSIAAWCSGLLYFFSRIPQIVENSKKRSVEGLSLGLFVFTLTGNLTYGLSILLRGPALDWAFVRSDLPYVLGSIGVLSFDMMIIWQAYLFGELKWENL